MATISYNGAILKTSAAALRGIDEENAAVFTEPTELGHGSGPAAKIWRKPMTVNPSFFLSETSQRLRTEGRAEERAEAILDLLRERRIDVPSSARKRILSCRDLEVLMRWFRRAVTATDIADVFAG